MNTLLILAVSFLVVIVIVRWKRIQFYVERFWYDYSHLFVSYDSVIPQKDAAPLIRYLIPTPATRPARPIRVFHVCHRIVNDPPTPKTFNILLDAEPHTQNLEYTYDLIVTTKSDLVTAHPPNVFYIPTWSQLFAESHRWSIPDLLRRRTPVQKTKFCAYMYSNCTVTYREELFQAFHARKFVDALGQCNKNVSIPDTRYEKNWIDLAVEQYRPYKFVLTCENTRDLPGYVSEKMVLALLAGCVPIYAGHASVKDHFNPACFINLADFETLEHCIQFVLQVDTNPSLLAAYQTASICTPEQLRRHAPWYYAQDLQGGSALYDALFQLLPEFRRQPYVPLPQRRPYVLDPTCPIKVINLDRSQERWHALVNQQFRRKPFLRYERFPAVDGKRVMDQYSQWIDTSWVEKARDIRVGVGHFKPGEIGIYLSVMELYTCLVKDPDNDWYCIFEDDVVFDDTLQPIETYIREAPADWEMLYLGVLKQYCRIQESKQAYIRLDLHCMPGNHAVVVRKRAAQFFLNFAFPIQRPIDEFHRSQFGNLCAYVCNPQPVQTAENIASTIQ